MKNILKNTNTVIILLGSALALFLNCSRNLTKLQMEGKNDIKAKSQIKIKKNDTENEEDDMLDSKIITNSFTAHSKLVKLLKKYLKMYYNGNCYENSKELGIIYKIINHNNLELLKILKGTTLNLEIDDYNFFMWCIASLPMFSIFKSIYDNYFFLEKVKKIKKKDVKIKTIVNKVMDEKYNTLDVMNYVNEYYYKQFCNNAIKVFFIGICLLIVIALASIVSLERLEVMSKRDIEPLNIKIQHSIKKLSLLIKYSYNELSKIKKCEI